MRQYPLLACMLQCIPYVGTVQDSTTAYTHTNTGLSSPMVCISLFGCQCIAGMSGQQLGKPHPPTHPPTYPLTAAQEVSPPYPPPQTPQAPSNPPPLPNLPSPPLIPPPQPPQPPSNNPPPLPPPLDRRQGARCLCQPAQGLPDGGMQGKKAASCWVQLAPLGKPATSPLGPLARMLLLLLRWMLLLA